MDIIIIQVKNNISKNEYDTGESNENIKIYAFLSHSI